MNRSFLSNPFNFFRSSGPSLKSPSRFDRMRLGVLDFGRTEWPLFECCRLTLLWRVENAKIWSKESHETLFEEDKL